MEGNYRQAYEWADESDDKQVHVYPAKIKRSKLEDGLEKTKAVASTGFRKIKRGSTGMVRKVVVDGRDGNEVDGNGSSLVL
ncbi:hypothetical protein E3N88_39392 [Mikania micrantha]|uniref:Uncharacterized protein n=1 Tax=Mikania micrantha TaxID=192012 RepID=A0A5N6LXI5_9ASTR|nr:hypothetical protein E3N88_39392 [Mikania micrantha]